MRNLKKILALALALVMTLSLMTVANAAFTDSGDIDDAYSEAVTVLSELGVFKGVNDGSNFAPKQTITRGEVAAIIYRIVTGDVTDSKAGLYASYAETSFSDVKSTDWYAGYIGYCSNAGLIKGDGAGHFLPATTVNGYQALAMILRAVGYGQSGEFEGSGWELRTASTATSLGLLKNVSAGSLGNPAAREVVAEILFQAISATNMVAPNSITGYHDLGYTLGYSTFKLERIQGVVTANEYADLYGAAPEDEGVTVLETADGDRTLSYSSELTDIGESRYAYVVGSKVLALADTGLNTVFQTGAATDISTNAKFEKATGLEDAAESFLNFADGTDDTYEAEIRIVYSLTGDNDDAKTIKLGAALTDGQYQDLYDIFSDDDYATGWVVVGTKYDSTDEDENAKNDVSNDMTWRAFVREYLTTDSKDTVTVDGTENGEWLKVIDNNGDGKAEYVFKTEFAMAQITNITSKGVYTFASLATTDAPSIEAAKVDEADIFTSDELAEGDVVIYTIIDGVYYVDIAEVVTGAVDKKGINSKNETMTVDGTTYTQSHIGYQDLDNTVFYADVTDAHTEYTYDLYLDHFGYVRLFADSAYNNGFVLLTDGYYWTNNRDSEYQATIYDREAEELVDVDVAAGRGNTAASNFIDIYEGDNGDKGTWNRLYEAGQVYFGDTWRNDPYITNIAAFTAADGVYTLTEVENASNRVDYAANELDTTDIKLNDRLLTDDNDGTRIQTTTGTVYYLVVKGANGKVAEVLSWTGYRNAPAEAVLGDTTYAYAVTHESATSAYALADVVVFETNTSSAYDTYFVYETNNWRTEYVWGIGYNDDHEIVDDQVYVEVTGAPAEIEFYRISEKGGMSLIYRNYDSYNIYAGYVNVIKDVTDNDYIQVTDTAAGELYFSPEEGSDDYAPIYQVYVDENDDYDVKPVVDWSDIPYGSAMILFTDGTRANNVEYAILVGNMIMPLDADDAPLSAVADLWQDIMDDAAVVDPTALEQLLDAVLTNPTETDTTKYQAKTVVADNVTPGKNEITISKAQEVLKALKEYDDSVKATAAATKLEAAIKTYTDSLTALGTAKKEAKDALEVYYNALTIANADIPAAQADYEKALTAIDNATTEAAIDKALADGMATLKGYDDTEEYSDLAKALLDAGVDLNTVVGTLKAEGLDTADEIRKTLYTADSKTMDEVIPALVANDYAVEDIYDCYIANSKDVADITKALAGAKVPAEDIIEGYVASWLDDSPAGLTNVTVTKEDDGSYTVAVKSDSSISGTGLQKLLLNCGLEAEDITVTWTSLNSGSENSASLTDFVKDTWSGLMTNVKAGTHSYDVVIEAGSLEYTLSIVPAAE